MITALVNEKLLGIEGMEYLSERFPAVNFLTDESKGESADVAIVLPRYFRRHPLENHPNLQFVQLLMVGLDRFDLQEANKRKITVANAQDVFSSTTLGRYSHEDIGHESKCQTLLSSDGARKLGANHG